MLNEISGTSASVAVIGSGFCGTMVAAHLLRRSACPVDIALIERGVFSRGAAYGTREWKHLLNVPAAKMSALPDEPEHFLRWVLREGAAFGYTGGPTVLPETFVPRMIYGPYLDEVLKDAARGPARLQRVVNSAVGLDVSGGRAIVRLEGGGVLRADRVVLALGNFPPRFPGPDSDAFRRSSRYIENPWAADALDMVAPLDAVLLVGTGLTMADIVVSLRDRGHQGTVHAVSRHGLLPQPHRRAVRPDEVEHLDHPACGPRALLRRLRVEARRLEARGESWHDAVDSLKAHTQRIWHGWEPVEKRRFLRHARVFWEVHRHRLPPEIHAVVVDSLRSGRLQARAASIEAYCERDGLVEVSIRPRFGAVVEKLRVAWVFNCTGPESDFRRVQDPLVRGLLDQGLVRPDPLRLGLETDDLGAVLDQDGKPSAILFSLGPALRPLLWEITAVPDLRVQALALACRLESSIE